MRGSACSINDREEWLGRDMIRSLCIPNSTTVCLVQSRVPEVFVCFLLVPLELDRVDFIFERSILTLIPPLVS